MENAHDAINVFNYFDYREYLGDCLACMAKDCKDPEMVCFTGFQLLPRSKPIWSC